MSVRGLTRIERRDEEAERRDGLQSRQPCVHGTKERAQNRLISFVVETVRAHRENRDFPTSDKRMTEDLHPPDTCLD